MSDHVSRFLARYFRENPPAKLGMKIMSTDIFSYGPHFLSGLSKQTIFYKLNLLPPVSCVLSPGVPYLVTNKG